MADAFEIQLAEAVAADLNAHTFAPPYESLGARRRYVPVYDIEQGELDDLKVTVLAPAFTLESDTRSDGAAQYKVMVGVQQRVQGAEEEDRSAFADRLALLVEQIAEYLLDPDKPPYLSAAYVLTAEVNPLYDADLLEECRVFSGVITATLEARREL